MYEKNIISNVKSGWALSLDSKLNEFCVKKTICSFKLPKSDNFIDSNNISE